MEHLSETERTAVPSLSKEDFIRYTTLALRDCFDEDIRTEGDDTITLLFATGERFFLHVSK